MEKGETKYQSNCEINVNTQKEKVELIKFIT